MRSTLSLVALLLVGCAARPAAPAAQDLSPPLPVDPDIRTGTFDNGLRYFIEVNQKPRDKAVLRLAIDAGSLLEDDDQRGLAHVLEHMAFNGTERFPGNELIAYLERVGTQFGAHLNAHTSFDETVYKLTVPTDDAEVFATGLDVLREWACCLALDPEEIDKERGVVMEEWRLRQGLQQRLQEVQLPLDFGADARHIERLPIGTPESLEGFTHEAVERYFRDWYRPDLMAVVVVGDVDPDAVEAQLRERFATLPAAAGARERARYPVEPSDAPAWRVLTDPELPVSVFTASMRVASPQPRTEADWFDAQVQGLALSGLNERLAELTRQPDSPLRSAQVMAGQLDPDVGSQRVMVVAMSGRELEAIERVMTEVARFREHGLTADELEVARASLIEGMDRYEREVDDTHSDVHANEIVRHAMQGEPMPGTRLEAQLTRDAAARVDLADVATYARAFLAGPAAHLLMMPESAPRAVPAEAELRALIERVATTPTTAPEGRGQIEQLVAPPAPGEIASRDDRYVEDLGFEGWVLANGARVYAKRTDFKAGEVRVTAWRRGGHAAMGDEQLPSIWGAGSILWNSGLGEHDRSALTRFTAGKTLSASASVSDDWTSLRASASPRDLGDALAMLHLHRVAPRFTDEGAAVALDGWRDTLRNRLNLPEAQFDDAWSTLLRPDDPRRRPVAIEDVDRVELDYARQVFTRAMGSPEEWTWVFVGDLPDDLEALTEVWIGGESRGEPGLPRVDRGYRPRPGEHREVIRAASAERATFRTVAWAPIEAEAWDPAWRLRLSSFADVLQVLLRERLREDLGGVYGVGVSATSWDWPYAGANLQVSFSCDPGRVDELEAAMREVFAQVRRDGIDPSYLEAERAKNRESRRDALRTNGFWLGLLAGALQYGEDPTLQLDFDAMNETVTADAMRPYAELLLGSPNRGTLVLLPKEADGDAP